MTTMSPSISANVARQGGEFEAPRNIPAKQQGFVGEEGESGDLEFTSESLLHIAKTDGFEAALEELAGEDGDSFENSLELDMPELLQADEVSSEEERILEPEDIEQIKDQTQGEAKPREVTVPVLERIESLKERVSKLEDGDTLNAALIEAILLLAESKDSEGMAEEKISLFELFVAVIGRIMLEVAPGGQEVIEKNKGKDARGKKTMRMADIRDLIAKRKKNDTPVIENKAA